MPRLRYGRKWVRFTGHDAIVLYPYVFFREKFPPADLIKHELVHVKQVQRLGWFKFYFLYLWYSIRYGYENNPFEVEARIECRSRPEKK